MTKRGRYALFITTFLLKNDKYYMTENKIKLFLLPTTVQSFSTKIIANEHRRDVILRFGACAHLPNSKVVVL
jgi:hypothetical protein